MSVRAWWRTVAVAGGALAVAVPLLAARAGSRRAQQTLGERLARAVAGYVALVAPRAGAAYDPRGLLVSARGITTLPGWSAPVEVFSVRTPLVTAGGPNLPQEVWWGMARQETPRPFGDGVLVPLKDADAWDVVGAVWIGDRAPPRDHRLEVTTVLVGMSVLGVVWTVGGGRRKRRMAVLLLAVAVVAHGVEAGAAVRRTGAWATERVLREVRVLVQDAPVRLPGVRSRVALARLARVVEGTAITLAEADSGATAITRQDTPTGLRATAPVRLGPRRWVGMSMLPIDARLGAWLVVAVGGGLVGVAVAAVAGWGSQAAMSPRRLRETVTAWGFLAPAALHLAVFSFGPIAFAAWLALHDWSLLEPVRRFVGLANFAAVAGDPLVRISLRNTVVYALYVPVTMALALGAALVLQRPGRLTHAVRTAFLVPYVASVVAIALVWQWMLNPDFGLVNWVVASLGGPALDWLGSPRTALLAVMLVSVWVQLGYQMMIFVAGLQGIPQAYQDAARVDGATAWQCFWRVTFPLLRPVTLFVLVTGVIGSFQVFTYIYVLTDGGPLHATDVIVYRIYQSAWEFLQFGYASALALVLFAILLGVTGIQFRLLGRRIEYG